MHLNRIHISRVRNSICNIATRWCGQWQTTQNTILFTDLQSIAGLGPTKRLNALRQTPLKLLLPMIDFTCSSLKLFLSSLLAASISNVPKGNLLFTNLSSPNAHESLSKTTQAWLSPTAHTAIPSSPFIMGRCAI